MSAKPKLKCQYCKKKAMFPSWNVYLENNFPLHYTVRVGLRYGYDHQYCYRHSKRDYIMKKLLFDLYSIHVKKIEQLYSTGTKKRPIAKDFIYFTFDHFDVDYLNFINQFPEEKGHV